MRLSIFKKKNKQGNVKLVHFIMMAIIGLFVIGLMGIILYLVNSSFFDEFNASGFADDNTAAVESGIMGSILLLDWVIVILLVFSLIGVAILGWQNTEPTVFFILLFFFAVFLGIVSYFFNYMFYQIVTDSAFASVVNYFPNSILICTNFHWIALVMLIVGGYASYSASKSFSGGGVP